MPIYAYKCESCGFAKDVLQKISDQPLSQCPTCGVQAFKKQVTAAGFQLKGSGWYATDFKGGAKAAPETASGDSGEKAPTKSDGAADSSSAKTDSKAKPAETTATKKSDTPVASSSSTGTST